MIFIINLLRRQARSRSESVSDICNIVLNSCYDTLNAQIFIDEGGMQPLLFLLRNKDSKVLISVLSAIQGICYIPGGRQVLRQENESLQRIIQQLVSIDAKVRSRSTGIIHNLSVDMVSIVIIREMDCIPLLVNLLRDCILETCQAAAGTLQNMSREFSSKELILNSSAIQHLTDLLVSSDVQCQVAAVGALLNLLHDTVDGDGKQRLRQVMTDAVVLGAMRNVLFDPASDS